MSRGAALWTSLNWVIDHHAFYLTPRIKAALGEYGGSFWRKEKRSRSGMTLDMVELLRRVDPGMSERMATEWAEQWGEDDEDHHGALVRAIEALEARLPRPQDFDKVMAELALQVEATW